MDTKPINKAAGIQYNPTERPLGVEGAEKASARERGIDKAETEGVKKSVDVDVSSRGRELAQAHQKALDIARATPEVREDRVAELKELIANGKYEIRPDKIADGMMREALLERLAMTDS